MIMCIIKTWVGWSPRRGGLWGECARRRLHRADRLGSEEGHEELYQVHKIAVLGEGNLNFDGPGEITDINKESDIWVVAKIKLLIRETIFVLLNVCF